MALWSISLQRQTREKHFNEAHIAVKEPNSITLFTLLKASLLIASLEWNSENLKEHFRTPSFSP